MAVMTVSEARAALPEVLNRVSEGEEITITRHGQAVAIIVRPDIMWSRSRAQDALAEAEQLRALMHGVGESELPAGGLTQDYAEELIAALRSGRDGR